MIRIEIADALTVHTAHGVLVVRAPSDDPIVPALTAALESSNGTFRKLAQTIVENNFDVPAMACVTLNQSGNRVFLIGDITAHLGGSTPSLLDGSTQTTWIERDLDPSLSIVIAASAPVRDETSHGAAAGPTAGSASTDPNHPVIGSASAEVADLSTQQEAKASSPSLEAHRATSDAPVVPDPNLIGFEAPQHGVEPTSDPIRNVPDADQVNDQVPRMAAPGPPAEPPDRDVTLDAESVREQLSHSPEPTGQIRDPLVTAKVCPCGTANPLALGECRSCGSSLRRDGVSIRQAPRPPLGFLVFDDGFRHELSAHVVIGRSAPTDYHVGDQLAEAITVTSPQKHVSKAHVEVRLIDWTINVIDLDSANGTYVEGIDGRSPRRLRPNIVEQLRSGDVVQFGDRSFTLEATPGL